MSCKQICINIANIFTKNKKHTQSSKVNYDDNFEDQYKNYKKSKNTNVMEYYSINNNEEFDSKKAYDSL